MAKNDKLLALIGQLPEELQEEGSTGRDLIDNIIYEAEKPWVHCLYDKHGVGASTPEGLVDVVGVLINVAVKVERERMHDYISILTNSGDLKINDGILLWNIIQDTLPLKYMQVGLVRKERKQALKEEK